MKKTGILNKDISCIIAGMGHRDTITICDAGLPIPQGVKRVDLAVREGIPGFIEVLETVLTELKVQKITIAEEMETASPITYKKIEETLGDIEIEMIPHTAFKERTKLSMAVIRTGEFTPYANIILESGVIF